MPFYEKGPVRIHYEEAGSGFRLLLIAGGGLNSTISGVPRAGGVFRQAGWAALGQGRGPRTHASAASSVSGPSGGGADEVWRR
jgi:hypothetical protein